MKITQNETLKAEGVSSFDFEAETTKLQKQLMRSLIYYNRLEK